MNIINSTHLHTLKSVVIKTSSAIPCKIMSLLDKSQQAAGWNKQVDSHFCLVLPKYVCHKNIIKI